MAAAFKPNVRIFAITNNKKTFTNTTLLFGVTSRYLEYEDHSAVLEDALKKMIEAGDVAITDRVIVVTDFKK